MTRKQLQQKYSHLVGCPTYIDTKTGYLIIDSKAKVDRIYKCTGVGMFIGLVAYKKGYELGVSYDRGFLSAVYQPKYTKII